MNKILAAIDNSAAACPVLAMSAAVAPVLGAVAEAVHVADDEDGRTAQASAESFQVPFRTVVGEPIEQLTALAAESDVVAVAVGARGRPGAIRPAGHLAMAMANSIDKPVLVVPPDAPALDTLERVVIALEGTPGKARSLKRAVELAAGAGLQLTVVHVDDEDSIPLFSDQVQHEVDAYAQEFLARYCPGAPHARLTLRFGVPADEIMAAVDEADAQLLAIGWPQTSEPGRGLVVRQILDRIRIPMLLVAIA